MEKMKTRAFLACVLALSLLLFSGCAGIRDFLYTLAGIETVEYADPGEFSGEPFVSVGDPLDVLDPSDLTPESFEEYGELDDLGRCTYALACVGEDLMPEGERGAIGGVKPTGWHTVKYDIVDGNYLYNRCHLIGWQLSGENANKRNLITGTRYMNTKGMLPFENMIADYVKETGNHVLYLVEPRFEGDELVARGVYMSAYSVEDSGGGVSFSVFCFNAQPGVEIDYATGGSRLAGKG